MGLFPTPIKAVSTTTSTTTIMITATTTFLPFSAKHHNLTIPKYSSLRPPPALATTTSLQNRKEPILTRWQQPSHPKSNDGRPLLVEDPAPDLARLLRIAIQRRDLDLGRELHAILIRSFFGEQDVYLFNMVMTLYFMVGCISYARKVFDEMPVRDVVSYSSLMACYAKHGLEEEAIRLFFRMRISTVEPNEYTFVAALSACVSNEQLFSLASGIHSLAVKTNYCCDTYVGNALMACYVKNGCFTDAVQLFDKMFERDVTSWNTVMSGMVKESRYSKVLELFRDMRMEGIHTDHFTLSNLLVASERGCFIAEGQGIHAHCIKTGLESNLSVGNALISFYTSSGHVEDVVDVFQRMPVRDIISWTGMVNGYLEFGDIESALHTFNQMPEKNSITYNSFLAGFCRNGDGSKAIETFQKMVRAGMELSDFTLASAVKACALTSELKKSRQLHAFVIKVGRQSNSWVETALLDMCIKCSRMEDGLKILNRWSHEESYLIAWTSMVCGYMRNGQPDEALRLFDELTREEDLISLDEVAIATILGICGMFGFAGVGREIHGHAIKSGDVFDVAVGNAIFSTYSKCGDMDDALKFFHSMHTHDIVSWNALLNAHLLHRDGNKALAVWREMEVKGMKPDEISFLMVISACKHTNYDSVNVCRGLFASMRSYHGIRPSEGHYAAFVEVLCQWNCFQEAEELIKNMAIKPGAIVWRSLLHSCRLQSNSSLGKQAMQQILALKPVDPSTYVLISNIYSSSGRWHCSEKVREEMREMGMRKHPAQSWTIYQNKIHSFYVRDKSHPQSKDIYSALDILILECMKVGYAPDNSYVLHEVEEYQKRDFLFYHSAKLAIVYGILITDPRKPVRAMKNVRLCGDCHSFLKYVSIVTGRVFIVRDSTGFHHFKCGHCTCRDCW